MSGLHNTYKRILNTVKGRGYATGAERQAKREGQEKGAMDAIFEGGDLPDLEEGKRRAKRKQAGRRGSRAETIMTDQLGS